MVHIRPLSWVGVPHLVPHDAIKTLSLGQLKSDRCCVQPLTHCRRHSSGASSSPVAGRRQLPLRLRREAERRPRRAVVPHHRDRHQTVPGGTERYGHAPGDLHTNRVS